MNTRMKKLIICCGVVLLTVLYLYTRSSAYKDLHAKDISLKSLLFAAIRAAEAGGFQVLNVREQSKFDVQSKGRTKEGINDPVTAADYRSHCVMYHSLKQVFPGLTIISEEVSKDCDKVIIPDLHSTLTSLEDYDIKSDEMVHIDDVTVWIDPLDATKEYTENLLQYVTTMVCVAVKGKPVIGIIYKPFETRKHFMLYWGWTNHGLSANIKKIPKLSEDNYIPTLIVSRSHAGHVNNASKTVFGSNVEIISVAGAGYKFLEVAVGNATAYVHMTAIKKWDICAGTAILSALGGKTTSLFNGLPIHFGPEDDRELTMGLLATMSNHKWYLQQFSKL